MKAIRRAAKFLATAAACAALFIVTGAPTGGGGGGGGGGGLTNISLIARDSGGATVTNELVIPVTGNTTPNLVTIAGTGSTNGVIGVCSSGCGAIGNVTVITGGPATCVFDNATTANDYAIASTTAGGKCHDAGATPPAGSVQVIGQVTATGSAGAQTLKVNLNPFLNLGGIPICPGTDTFNATGGSFLQYNSASRCWSSATTGIGPSYTFIGAPTFSAGWSSGNGSTNTQGGGLLNFTSAAHFGGNGHWASVSACGTGGSTNGNSSDISGTITVGTTASGSCTLTFNSAYNAVVCLFTPHVASRSYFTTARTANSITIGGVSDGDVIDYICGDTHS